MLYPRALFALLASAIPVEQVAPRSALAESESSRTALSLATSTASRVMVSVYLPQMDEDSAKDEYRASVVGADAQATTYVVDCDRPSGVVCSIFHGATITDGPKTWTMNREVDFNGIDA